MRVVQDLDFLRLSKYLLQNSLLSPIVSLVVSQEVLPLYSFLVAQEKVVSTPLNSLNP
jgi:hypothetical protein